MNVQLKKHQPPGTAIYTGSHKVDTIITHLYYNQKELKTTEDLALVPDHSNWYVVKGLANVDKIKSFCDMHQVDPLVVEDILNVNQRNKIEYYDGYVFSVLSYSYMQEQEIRHDYLSVLLFKDKVFTFHEHNLNLYEEVTQRLTNNLTIVHTARLDYLFYAILDTIVDNDIIVEKELADRTLRLEEDLMGLDASDQTVLYNSRKELLTLHRAIDPIYDSFRDKTYMKSPLINADIYRYFDDIYDHVRRISEDINTERETLRNLLDVYMNNISNKMNQVMKTLTIFSAIFIPLSFLAGVFGMNFVQFSILENPNGLLIFIMICFTIAILMLLFFRWRKWF